MSEHAAVKIGIIGGGFAGTALLAALCKFTDQPIEIIICEKSGQFGAGPAYSTPFKHHLLNVRASDMSAFEDEPMHFVHWLRQQKDKMAHLDSQQPLAQQFVPRCFYYDYLQQLLQTVRATQSERIKLTFLATDVIDVVATADKVQIVTSDAGHFVVDKVVLALGNNPPSAFPFAVGADIKRIDNPWDYRAIADIASDEPVLIIGTGLSMIDAVLTLHQQGHQGVIYALSRHGLLPLPHGELLAAENVATEQVMADMTAGLTGFTRKLRARSARHEQQGGDWRSVVGGLRAHIPAIWQQASFSDKKRFLRHLLPYWNIHRHRVHTEITGLLQRLINDRQLVILAGRVLQVSDGQAAIKLRHTHAHKTLAVRWLVNCMGPQQQMRAQHQPLVAAVLQRQMAVLDELQLGFAVSEQHALLNSAGQPSSALYSLGAPTRGLLWEITAVPDIRKQAFELSRVLLG